MDQVQSTDYAKKYLEDVLSFFGLNVDVGASHEDEVIELSVPSTHLNGFLIGQHGDNLRSLQFIVSQALRSQGAELTRVNIDIADYKRQRAERLAEQVREWIKEIRSSGKSRTLSPMNAADRRVVHKTIAEYDTLETHSEGEGRDRHVVISLRDDIPLEIDDE